MSKNRKFNEYIIPPGETIKELLESRNITQLDLSLKTGINKKTINEIINGKAPISISTAQKLEYVFNIPASFWNNLERNYQETLERKKDFDSILEEEKYLEKIPYLEMSKRGWDFITKTRDSFEKVKNLRKFFSVASLNFDTDLKRKMAFRKSTNNNFSFESLYCWIRYGEIQANKEDCEKFDLKKLKLYVPEIKKLANKSFLEQYDKMKKILNKCGIILIFEPHLPNTYINGVTYKLNGEKGIIMISDRGKKDDILWFTLFHEIGHLLKHGKKEIFIDMENGENSLIETEADNFAKNSLIPCAEYQTFKKSLINEKNIIEFSKKINVTPGIVVGRLQKDGIIGWNQFNNLIERI